jgi:hypothetical protein
MQDFRNRHSLMTKEGHQMMAAMKEASQVHGVELPRGDEQSEHTTKNPDTPEGRSFAEDGQLDAPIATQSSNGFCTVIRMTGPGMR